MEMQSIINWEMRGQEKRVKIGFFLLFYKKREAINYNSLKRE